MSEAEPVEHHRMCDFWFEHNDRECSCGLTAPKAPWFDAMVARHEAAIAELRQVHE